MVKAVMWGFEADFNRLKRRSGRPFFNSAGQPVAVSLVFLGVVEGVNAQGDDTSPAFGLVIGVFPALLAVILVVPITVFRALCMYL